MDFNNAMLITSEEYMKLINPKFEGQTRAGVHGLYRMYWSVGDNLYYTENKL